jgi:hypothetical protein
MVRSEAKGGVKERRKERNKCCSVEVRECESVLMVGGGGLMVKHPGGRGNRVCRTREASWAMLLHL